MKFMAAGNTMIDAVMQADGTISAKHMGGPAPFAAAGMRVFSDEVGLLSNAGQDFDDVFGEWATNGNINLDGLSRMTDLTHCLVLKYNPDGTYSAGVGKPRKQYMREMGYMELTTDQFAKHTVGCEMLYFFYDCANTVFWEQMKEIKEKNGWQLMWEMSGGSAVPENKEIVKKIIKDLNIELYSLNWPETKRFFETEDKIEGMRGLMSLGAPVVFFRDGINGSYVIKGDSYWHFPMLDSGSIDATGCGNTSTGTFAVGWHLTHDPVMAGAYATVAGSLNAAQYGLIPSYSAKQREEALRVAKEIAASVKEEKL